MQTSRPHPLLSLICFYLQPEHQAQQSAELQHPAFAAFAVPASPSAITTINTAAFNVFIIFSFRSGKSCSWADETVRVKQSLPGLLAISKCEVRALEEECLGPNAKESKRLRSQKRNSLRGSRPAPTLQHKDELPRAALRFVFESARFRLDSRNSNGAGSFLNRCLGCGRDGSRIPQTHCHDQGTVLR